MRITDGLVKKIENLSRKNRLKLIEVLYKAGGGHFGGSLSEMEILTVLYNAILKIDPKNPKWEKRDYFILSKGHGNAGFSIVLGQRGFFDPDTLYTFNEPESCFGMHPTIKIPGVEIPTGSLGHGLSIGVGIAQILKMDKKDNRVYVLMGDGELHEGTIWEAAMSAPRWRLDNLIGIVDRNRLSMDGPTETCTIPLEPLVAKWKSFNWGVKKINGHNIRHILEAFNEVPFKTGFPSVIIADTVKGKGVPFMENKHEWHYNILNDEDYEEAISCVNQVK